MEEIKIFGAIQVRDAMTLDFITVSRKMPAKGLLEKMSKEKDKVFYVINSKAELVGAIHKKEVQTMLLEKDLSIFIADDVNSTRTHANVHGKLYDSRDGFAVYYRYEPRNIEKLCLGQKAHQPKIEVGKIKIHRIICIF